MKKQTVNAEEKALDVFAEMMIEKIQSLTSADKWQKPWFTNASLGMPKNLNGRYYNGMNALMLLMACEKFGYKIPRFCTFDAVQRLNKDQKKDAPLASVNKGEKSFPVFITTYTCVNAETHEKIKYDEYRNLSDEERENILVFPKLQVFRVFNVEQTNLRESRPELWKKLEAEYATEETPKEADFSFAPVDGMIAEQAWICPIEPTYGDEAYFSISKNKIVIPKKEQFKDGESFYTNLFHEMAHSTGHETQLGRIKPAKFGSEDYAKEELVAELTAALTAQHYGMTKNIKSDSACYLKAWLGSLKEDPKFIKTVLLDVRKAFSLLSKTIDECETTEEKTAAA